MGPTPNISAAMCTRGRTLAAAQASPDGTLVAAMMHDGAGARIVVVPAAGGPERIVAVDPPPAAFAWTPDGQALLTATADRRICRTPLTGGPGKTILAHPDRLAAPAVSPDGTRVAYVVDDRHVEVAPLDRSAPPVRLTTGADFAFDPAWSPDSATVAWHEWDVPDMPWDGGRIVTRPADAATPPATVAGGPGIAVQQPRFSPDGRLGYLCDATGWLNLWVDGRPLLDEPCEHGDPAWGQGQRSWCWSPDGRSVALNRNEAGFGRLVVIEAADHGTARPLAKAVHRSITWTPAGIVAIRTGAKTPTQLVTYDPATGDRTTLAHGPVAGFEPALQEPDAVTWQADDGAALHGLLYGAGRADKGPLMVQIHGGPVGQNQAVFDAKTAYWLARGWRVFVPDFRGSTGHGRAYQQAINGRWGEVDVDDIAAGVRALNGHPNKTVLVGGSSGGMAALLLLARHPQAAAAAAVSYPVVDLVGLARGPHRVEAHSNDRLVGTSRKLLKARSPLAHLDRITAPLLVFHGLADEVVPPRQSRALVRGLTANGVDAELVEYPGEGHGFRQPRNVEDQLARTEAFFARKVLGLSE